jgi:HlyD family secretion protein
VKDYGVQKNGVVTYEGTLHVDNVDRALKPGMTASVDLVTEAVHGALVVDNAAFRYTPPKRGGVPNAGATAVGGRSLWLLRNGAPTSVTVRTGVTDGERTAVLGDALHAGDVVIVGERAARTGGA